MTTTKERELEDLRVLFQTQVHDTAYFKRQQWHATHYAVLSYAAIVSLLFTAKNIGLPIGPYTKFVVLFILIPAVLIGAGMVVNQLIKSLEASRKCSDCIVAQLSKAFKTCYDSKWANLDRKKRDWPLPWFFHAYNIAGAGVATYIVWILQIEGAS